MFAWQNIQQDGVRPEIREASSFVVIGSHGYIHGGLSMKILDDLWKLNLEDLQWQKVTSGDSHFGRCGHSSHTYGRNVIVFGGERKYNS